MFASEAFKNYNRWLMSMQERKQRLTWQMRAFREAHRNVPVLANEGWVAYGSTARSYDNYFEDALGGHSLMDIIVDNPSPVAIDLMAPSFTLSDMFKRLNPNASPVGIAVSLKDRRTPHERARDEDLGIIQIAGDLTRNLTWKKIQESLGDRKANLIMERGIGAWEFFPQHEKLFGIILSRLWNMLSDDGGVLALETPFSSASLLGVHRNIRYIEWVELCSTTGIKISQTTIRTLAGWHDMIVLRKTPNSPEELPHLPRRR